MKVIKPRCRRTVPGSLVLFVVAVLFAASAAVLPAGGSREAGDRNPDRDQSRQPADGTPVPADDSPAVAPLGPPPVPAEELPEGFSDQAPPGRAAAEFTTDFSRATVSFGDILSGGPPKGGIPAIDDPRFVTADDAGRWVAPQEPVLVVEAAVAARATGADTGADADVVHVYPLQILTWHEIVNDTVGGVPVTVTYCPLCNTGVAFHRVLHGTELSFNTTGRLRFSNLIMYDRETESWFQQASGEAIAGYFAGTRLQMVPVMMMSYEDAIALWPDANVLSRDTGYTRAYGRNPYVGYDSTERPFLLRGAEIGPGPVIGEGNARRRIQLMDRVVSLSIDGESTSVAYPMLSDEQVVQRRLGGEEVVFLWAPGTASALDSADIAEGADVGSANAFLARTRNGTPVSLQWNGRAIVDEETESEWNAAGFAVAGPLRGQRLTPAPGVQHFWFSHAALIAGD